MPFWWIVRGLRNALLEVPGLPVHANARLRLYKNENLAVEPLAEFDLCRTNRSGVLFQVAMAAKSESFDFLEAMMRCYPGGAKNPQFLSSGLEDYFLGTYYFNRGLYHLPEAGLTHKDEKNFSFSGYRFHDADPILFSNGFRLACRCGEKQKAKSSGRTACQLERLTQHTPGFTNGSLRILHKGMFPCFFRGMVSTLLASIRKARITLGRVSRGSMTSST